MSKGLSSGIVIGLTIVLVAATALAVFVALLFVQRRRRADAEKNIAFVETSPSSTFDSSVDFENKKLNGVNNMGQYAHGLSKLMSPYTSISSIGTTPTL